MGMPLERKQPEEIQSKYGLVSSLLPGEERKGEGEKTFMLPKGHGTDDTVQMMALTESILENQGVDQEALALKLADYNHPELGYSSSTRQKLKLITEGHSWQQVSEEDKESSFTNGAAMRIAPVALMFYNHPDLEENLLKTVEITHKNPQATVGALLQGHAIALACQQTHETTLDKINFIDQLIQQAQRLEEKYLQGEKDNHIFSQKLMSAKAFLQNGEVDSKEVVQKLGNDGTAQGSVVTSIYSFLRYPYSFREAVIYAVNLGGDADTLGAMTGAISGAFLGREAIPKGWISNLHPMTIQNNVKDSNYILSIAQRLFELTKHKNGIDNAMSIRPSLKSSINGPGGIDFTADKTPLEIQNSGKGIRFHLDHTMLQQLRNASGFVPVIINIQPMIDLKIFLGITSS
jgi:poly(ADP-ribose) glycohydrolase ARH3